MIVPVYGSAPYLFEALEGVLGQNPPPDDVIVVDDGSPD
ncbi:MAG: glycosyltransferase family 2 protein, partial [Actinomycetota bacterium]|nr:glycosyltransferase family 2 protein [Actinomycetota bacterium]